jgi:hypothetical protein
MIHPSSRLANEIEAIGTAIHIIAVVKADDHFSGDRLTATSPVTIATPQDTSDIQKRTLSGIGMR